MAQQLRGALGQAFGGPVADGEQDCLAPAWFGPLGKQPIHSSVTVRNRESCTMIDCAILFSIREQERAMTATLAGRLLISHITLRGPELAQTYGLVAAHPEISADKLREHLAPAAAGASPYELADAPLREALSFLVLAGLVEVHGRQRRYSATPRLPDTPFPLLLLHHLTTHPDRRQQAISLVHRAIVADDTLAITSQSLRDQLERGPLRDLFAWTGEKVTFWVHLAAHVGLVRRLERSPELLAVPQPRLLLDTLVWALNQLQGQSSLDGTLRLIDAQLFACFTARGRVHRGLAQTLLALERLGHLQLTHSADAAHSLLLGERRVSDVGLAAR